MSNTTEDLFKAFIEGTTSIEKVHTFLQQSIHDKVPPETCCALVFPLFSHAIENPTNPLEAYVDVLADIHTYLSQCAMMDDNVIFKDVAGILEELLYLHQAEGDFTALFNRPLDKEQIMRVTTLASAACLEVLRLFNGSESEPLCTVLWHLVPKSINMFVEEVDEQNVIVITKLSAIAEYLLYQHIIIPTDNEVSLLLFNMVAATLKYITFEDHINIIASCVSVVCTATPDLELPYTSDLSDLVNSLAASLVQSNNHTLCKAMFNVSLLLARNNAATPWLLDFDTIQYEDREIEVIKQMIAAADAVPEEEVDFTRVQELTELFDTYEGRAHDLITQLVNTETGSEECAMLLNELEYMAVHSGTYTVESLCNPHMKEITECVARLLLKDPDLATTIVSRIGYEPSKFLKKYLHFALPYAVLYTQDPDALLGLCNVFDQSPVDLVRQGASHVAIAILLEENSATQYDYKQRLVEIFREADILEQLVMDNRNTMMTTAAMNLGHPTQGQLYHKAMETINSTINGAKYSLSNFLSELLLGILEKVFGYITQVKNISLDLRHPYALQSLKIIIHLLDKNVNYHNRHIIKVFDAVLELPKMHSEALSLWKTYIDHLNQDAVKLNINTIMKGLCNILVVSPSPIRVQVANTLHDLLVHNRGITAEEYANFPVLPDFQELAAVKRLVHERQKVKVKDEVLNIILGFSSFDDGLVLSNLQKLQDILVNNPYDRCEVDKLYAHLFHLLRKYSTHEMISYYAAICLGLLGATDPSTVKMEVIDDTAFVMRNHNNDAENFDFVYDLIIHRIFPSYNTTNDETSRRSMEYSIQTLLRIVGFRSVKEMRKNKDSAAYKCWRRYPREVQEFLAPFLESTYEGTWPDPQEEYPIFTKARTFKEWVHKWYCCMTKGARGTAAHIFKACLPLIQSNMVDIGLHLLPYLVMHTILSGEGNAALSVANELKLVLEINAQPVDDPERLGMNRYALQVAVAITEYCRKWLFKVGRDDLSLSSMVERINGFLKLIPNQNMGVAAFKAGAYPQALMHFDTFMKEHHNNKVPNAEMANYLRQIYLETGQLEDYEALLNIYQVATNRDEQIVYHKNLGDWQYAETLLKTNIKHNPKDLAAYTSYLECLQKSNSFSSLLYELDNGLTGYAPWKPLLNTYRIDTAWQAQDWTALERAVDMPMERNARALVGCALHQMKNNLPIQLTYTIDEARSNITKQIARVSSDLYRKCYPQIFELQLLQELETSQEVWSNPRDAPDRIKDIQPLWDDSLGRIMPRSQYRVNLLEVRKAAFFDIRKSDLTKEYEADVWLDLYREQRKLGNMKASFDALVHAEDLLGRELRREKAKWYWKAGQVERAMTYLMSFNKKRLDPHDSLLLLNIYLDAYREKPFKAKIEGQMSTFAKAPLNVSAEKQEKACLNVIHYYIVRHTRDNDISENNIKLHGYYIKMSINALIYGSKYYYSTMSQLLNSYFWFEKTVKAAKQEPEDELYPKIMENAEAVNKMVTKAVEKIKPFQYILFLTRLISHLSTEDDKVASFLQAIIKKCFIYYPNNTIWLLLGALDSDSSVVARRMRTIFDMAKTESSNKKIIEIIQQATAVKNAFREVLDNPYEGDMMDLNDRGFRNPFAHLQDLCIYLPNEATLVPTLPGFIRQDDNAINAFPNPLPTIKSFNSRVAIMRSLQKPKRIKITGSDGEVYSFLLKKEDDLRNDARTMEFFYMINHFLRKHPQSRDKDLYIRTFAIVPLGRKWGLLEWIDNLTSLKTIVNGYWEAFNRTINQVGNKLNAQKLLIPKEKALFFDTHILPISPPVFYKWFLQHFPEPIQWLASRTRYIKTLAVMSIVGYIVGLGDRHADNIMFDITTGDTVHVDLNLVFGKGTELPVPELVPFRLTQNLTHAMGVLKTAGLYTKTCEVTMTVLNHNKQPLESVFQTLLNELDAADTSSNRLSLRSTQKGTSKIMSSLSEKLQIEKRDVNGKVQGLIDAATSSTNLASMFPGWAPYV